MPRRPPPSPSCPNPDPNPDPNPTPNPNQVLAALASRPNPNHDPDPNPNPNQAPAALASRLTLPPMDAYANGSSAYGTGKNTSSSSGGAAVGATAAELALRCAVPALGVASGGAAPVSASLNAQVTRTLT